MHLLLSLLIAVDLERLHFRRTHVELSSRVSLAVWAPGKPTLAAEDTNVET